MLASRRNPELSELLAEVNAHISEYAAEANLRDDVWEFVCECGREGCEERVSLPLGEYAVIRRSGDPVLAEGHTISVRADDARSSKRRPSVNAISLKSFAWGALARVARRGRSR